MTELPRTRSLALIVCLIGASSMCGITLAHMAHAGDQTDPDHLTKAGSTDQITNSGPLTFDVSTNLGSFSVSCNTVLASFTIPHTGFPETSVSLGPLIPQANGQPIDISGCTDSIGGTDTVTTAGSWTATFQDKRNDETTQEPNATGDKLIVNTPINAASLQSSIFTGCSLVLDPVAASKLSVAYNDNGLAAIPQGENPGAVSASGAGCPIMSVSETLDTSTLVGSVKFHDIS